MFGLIIHSGHLKYNFVAHFETIPLKQQQGFQYFSSVPVLHYLQAVPFIKI
jgi:hypothetical protein